MTAAAPLTQEEKDLCILAADLEADISEAWISFYNSTSGQNEIFDAADRGPDRAPIMLITPEASHGDRKLAVRVPQLVRALLALCRWRKNAIVRMENEIRRLKGEPEPVQQQAPPKAEDRKTPAQRCAALCQTSEFRQWLFEQGVDVSDQTRIDNHVRLRLNLRSRAEIDTSQEALKAWEAMRSEFMSTAFGRAMTKRLNDRRKGK